MSAGTNRDFPLRAPMLLGFFALFLLVGGFGTWAATTNISGAIIASGQIEVDQNRQVIQHPDGGVVSEILVDEGESVTVGEALIRLDGSQVQSELTIVEGQYFELVARRARLQAERDGKDTVTFAEDVLARAETDPDVAELVEGQRNLFDARRASIDSQIEQLSKRRDQISDQIIGIDAQQTALLRQLELIEEELVDQQSLLDRGLAQATRVLSLQREQARLSGTVGDLTAQKAQAEGRSTEIDIQILQLDTQRREEAITTLRDSQFQERELAEQRRALLERLERMVITAPVSGVVYGLRVYAPRSVIRAADPVMFLVPQDRPLVIAAQVPPLSIDQLYLDQTVSLRFPAFDQRETPELFGRVVQISADAFQDEGSQVSYYRVEIVLSEGQIDLLPEGSTLIPGMPVQAYIRTADRTPLAYLVKPFTDYFTKAFRES